MILAERLKELRQDNGLSQVALAKIIKKKKKAIDYWERGINEPKASEVNKNSRKARFVGLENLTKYVI